MTDRSQSAPLSKEDQFTMAHNVLNQLDCLLAEAGYKQDATVRHHLKIAKSMFRQAETYAAKDAEALAIELNGVRPYQKDGETAGECVARNRADTDVVLGQLAKATLRAEKAEAALRSDSAAPNDWHEAMAEVSNLQRDREKLRSALQACVEALNSTSDGVGIFSALVMAYAALRSAAPQGIETQHETTATRVAPAESAARCVSVPMEPTEAMIAAGIAADWSCACPASPEEIYRAMVAAAPVSPAPNRAKG